MSTYEIDESTEWKFSDNLRDLVRAEDVDAAQNISWSVYSVPKEGTLFRSDREEDGINQSDPSILSDTEDPALKGGLIKYLRYKPRLNFFGNDRFVLQFEDSHGDNPKKDLSILMLRLTTCQVLPH